MLEGACPSPLGLVGRICTCPSPIGLLGRGTAHGCNIRANKLFAKQVGSPSTSCIFFMSKTVASILIVAFELVTLSVNDMLNALKLSTNSLHWPKAVQTFPDVGVHVAPTLRIHAATAGLMKLRCVQPESTRASTRNSCSLYDNKIERRFVISLELIAVASSARMLFTS
ncbi:MAG: hypothetical protein JW384_01745 [Nitrosomonadaceae bacterium]|nr:hypothetical protein [Nitrosomonadaceae bacterium]